MLLTENSIKISVRIILSSTNKCCLWARTLRIVLTPVRLCDDSVTASPRIFKIGGNSFESRLPNLLRSGCPQVFFNRDNHHHNGRCRAALPKETLFYLQQRLAPFLQLVVIKQLQKCLYGVYRQVLGAGVQYSRRTWHCHYHCKP